ncbi:MAG: hypothetical protein A3F74_06250 [Betaproteobacteria bacterium RIFCSPLOWO2_12_FULL_62_58]|nr:MAG: hypothetical protein A3F74_06250 [Betaproteobacteria bacterium RIFCSPLOWO2_12_FULL_62_58]
MAHDDESSPFAEELAKLEGACHKTAQAIADARSVREVAALDDVEVPPHLQAIAYAKVPSLGGLRRRRDMRVEEIVKHQLSGIELERSDLVASREFDRIKAGDWYVLRANYPELYAKALREGNLILERKRKRDR